MALFSGTPGPDHLVGTINGDDMYGSGGNDGIFAGAGNDLVYGEAGDDIIGNDYGDDKLNGGANIDTVTFNYVNQQDKDLYPNATIGVVFRLAVTTQQDLGAWGKDTIVNFENVGGSLGNDKIWGDDNANVIGGDEGNDIVLGAGGNDWVGGGWGKDIIVGGLGSDRLYGNGPSAGEDSQRDTLRYSALSESTIAAADHIFGSFGAGASKDRIELKAIDADPTKAGDQAFKFIGSGAFTAKIGEVRAVAYGNDVRVYIDADADSGTEMFFLVHGVASLAATDFIL